MKKFRLTIMPPSLNLSVVSSYLVITML